jgi:uncharacterized integral membrane protein
MRFLSFLLLVIVAVVVALFAWQNNEAVSLQFYEWSLTTRMAILVAVCYVLGMLSGWFVVGMVRSSWRRVVDRPSR